MDIWTLWLALVVGSFLMIEIPALGNRLPGDTLSEHIWRWLRVKTPMSGRHASLLIAARCVLALFLAWLAGHLSMGWWS